MKPDLWDVYRQMLRSRLFEERVRDLWQEGKISGEMHMGLGEEAVVAGIVTHLEDGDAMALDHRGTPPLVIRGIDLASLLKELLGCPDGLCRGYGGHMHLFSPGFLAASSGIVGASGPIGAGFALASQLLRPGKIAVCFFGEGAVNQGMILESFNLAAIWKLPLIFVCKDNKLALTTYSPSVTAGRIMDRVRGFDLPVFEVDGVDVEAVWQTAREAVSRARRGEGPAFILARCVHFEGHFLGDPYLRIGRHPLKQMKKLSPSLMKSAVSVKGEPFLTRLKGLGKAASLIRQSVSDQKSRKFDPLYHCRLKLKGEKSRLEKIEGEVRSEIEKAFRLALSGMDRE